MTLALAICKPDALVLAADSRVGDGRGVSRTGDKIWELPGAYGVVTWGRELEGVSLQIQSYVPSSAAGVRAAAHGLMARLQSLPVASDWGFFLGGVEPSGLCAAQVFLPSGEINFLGGYGYWGAGTVGIATLPAWRGDIMSRPITELVSNALLLLEQAGAVDSDGTGPPYRALVIQRGTRRWYP